MVAFILNFVLFQLSWIALVAGAARGILWPGVALAGGFLAWELYRSHARSGLAALVGIAVLSGIVIDGGYALAGVVDYAQPAGPLAPWWILGLWVVFSLTLTVSMGWMRHRIVLGSLLAGFAAPMSYLAGHHLGAVEFPMGMTIALAVAALTWMPAIFLLVRLSRRLVPVRSANARPG